ncbi:MAG: hypothetical protein H0W69_10295 [Gemmatimonadaceae bacterium]|nr:hypothetical protein [Gemmatimonadaceae bacterium]
MTVNRSAFTVAELVVSLALLGLVVTLVLHSLASHQKVFRGIRHRILLNEQLRDGEAALVTDIRGAAVPADTLRILADSALEFFATTGSSVVCTTPSNQVVPLVPSDLSSGIYLSSIPAPPDTGDLLSIYSTRDSVSGYRRWLRFRISAVASAQAASVCPLSAGFTSSGDLSKPAYRISVVGSLVGVLAGAPVRVLRRGRYSLYRSSDGDWYLGYKRCNAVATGCSTIQPVSGPYLPYAAGSGGGLRFRYIDSFGAPVSSTRPLDVASVEIVLRGEVSAAGKISGRAIDSVLVTVTPRNIH